MQKLGLRLCDQAEMSDRVSPGSGSLESPLFFLDPRASSGLAVTERGERAGFFIIFPKESSFERWVLHI